MTAEVDGKIIAQMYNYLLRGFGFDLGDKRAGGGCVGGGENQDVALEREEDTQRVGHGVSWLLLWRENCLARREKKARAEIRTRITGFKVQGDSHYTTQARSYWAAAAALTKTYSLPYHRANAELLDSRPRTSAIDVDNNNNNNNTPCGNMLRQTRGP